MGGFLGHREVQVLAVCDVDTHRREDGRKRVEGFYAQQTDRGSFKGCAAFEDFRELVARPDIDAVVIATPDHWHALVSIAAAEAGKDIYCEKPLCKSVHESRAVINAVRKKQRVFQVGSMQRSMREFRVACELALNGVLGKIDHIDVTVGGPAVPCDLPEEAAEPGLNWDFWLGPAPKRPYNSVLSPRGVHNDYPNWRHYREYGGGAVTDFGAHHFDIAQWGLGMDGSGPCEFTPPADWQTAQSGVRMRYESGVELIHARVPGHNDITFYGKEGVVQVDRGRIEVTIGGKVDSQRLGAPEPPVEPAGEGVPAQPQDPALSQQRSPDRLAHGHSQPEEAHLRRRDRGEHRQPLQPGEPGLLSRPAHEVGPRARRICRRHRG